MHFVFQIDFLSNVIYTNKTQTVTGDIPIEMLT